MLQVTDEYSQDTQPQCSPSSAIAVLVTMAQDAVNNSNFAQAEALLKRAINKAELHFGTDSATVASLLWHLSVVYEQSGQTQLSDEVVTQVRHILANRPHH